MKILRWPGFSLMILFMIGYLNWFYFLDLSVGGYIGGGACPNITTFVGGPRARIGYRFAFQV